ncbi:MAG TPA: hypothetical protein VLT92_16215 [Burkholderiales bacterium]|nr:hypothetical protein [Burkholderiales bacterium]
MAPEKPMGIRFLPAPASFFACRRITTLACAIAVIPGSIHAFSTVDSAAHFVISLRNKKIFILIRILCCRIHRQKFIGPLFAYTSMAKQFMPIRRLFAPVNKKEVHP